MSFQRQIWTTDGPNAQFGSSVFRAGDSTSGPVTAYNLVDQDNDQLLDQDSTVLVDQDG